MRDKVASAMDVCSVEIAIAVIGGAWKLTVVKHLLGGPLRFGALGRAVGPVSARVLTRQLRELEEDGIVSRTVFAEVPPRVEYALTDLGCSLAPAVRWFDAWGARYCDEQGANADGGTDRGPNRLVGAEADPARSRVIDDEIRRSIGGTSTA